MTVRYTLHIALATPRKNLPMPGRMVSWFLSQLERTAATTMPIAIPIRQATTVICSVFKSPSARKRQRSPSMKFVMNSALTSSNHSLIYLSPSAQERQGRYAPALPCKCWDQSAFMYFAMILATVPSAISSCRALLTSSAISLSFANAIA